MRSPSAFLGAETGAPDPAGSGHVRWRNLDRRTDHRKAAPTTGRNQNVYALPKKPQRSALAPPGVVRMNAPGSTHA